MQIVEKAAAKINLSLDTPFSHSDGSQEWEMVMAAVDLADYVTITTIPKRTKIEVRTDTGFLPNDRRNLAFQAAHILQTRFHVMEGVRIEIEKHIPVAAGLGGGSSDAAAVLRGLNRIWKLGLTLAQLAEIGLAIDADVPFCVYSQTAYVTGKGEKIAPLPKMPAAWVVIAKPTISVSTPVILRQIDYERIGHVNTKALLEGAYRQDWQQMYPYMKNVLEPITSHHYPQIIDLKERMLQSGACAAQMSGTGPTVFGICENQSRAQRILNSVKGFCKEVYIVRTLG
ncbi:4-(cytidine 5'-diphospho)-2-C-methyl-D-erythritol kinase [Periweissella fabaria]|uniref:4-diphosphocytidyl-2-C-methyl-D-erythritol kinase n=1 Tax=Periweissella fabaria TaxID=546157 RepID=A0ABN8BL53_9LACO|nr:4-(cytidine 5'-diphospho)-2-C-methyl-D-erythritol kinase [Periweissella fabaria]MCM0597686.1 4-(cytidine 5'-diphospho)-2-C-methyl-D-erythritol kinase [Periweissella fabaria]CAH0416873.1 4-diphosphocytidyl-2-C-methyl-D-erythritol kinase [Periweissella fabaria]